MSLLARLQRVMYVVGALLAPAMILLAPSAAAQTVYNIGGSLESAAGYGNDLLIANAGAKQIQRVSGQSGQVLEVLVADVPDLGAVVVRGDEVYFATGNNGSDACTGTPTGTIEVLNLSTRERRLFVDNLVAPNGMTFVGDDLLYTSACSFSAAGGVYVVHPDGVVELLNGGDETCLVYASCIPAPDGLTAGSDGTVYVGSLLGGVYRLDPTTGAWSLVGATHIPATGIPAPIDDLTIAPDGWLYAASAVGAIYRVNPFGGDVAVVAAGPSFLMASAVKCDANGRLFVTTLNGVLIPL